MPIPTRAPVTPPTAPPTPRPAKPATIGPAAMNGPRPGIASIPMPAKTPSAPPIAPPVVTPTAVPSGAFVAFSVPMSFGPPRLSGRSTEISLVGKPARTRLSVAFSTATRVKNIPNTPTFLPDMSSPDCRIYRLLFCGSDCKLVCDIVFAGDGNRLGFDVRLFVVGADGAAQRHLAVLGDDLDVMGVGRKSGVLMNSLPNLLCDRAVGGIHLLLVGCRRCLILIHLGIVRCRLGVLRPRESRGREQ